MTHASTSHKGPLNGVRVLEFAGIGPGPHCCMLLADMGATVLRIDREGGNGWANPVADRGRKIVTLDIKSTEGKAFCRHAADGADVLIEGYRPGLMERLGLGPEVLMARNPRLIYGRVTGWGQEGPLAKAAGHDINYISLTGALAAFGRPGEVPPPPLNLVGDFGGGSMLMVVGVLAALVERQNSGKGQIVDAAMVDGASSLMSFFAGLVPSGRISVDRDKSLLGGAAHFYRCYACKDGKYISVGALEPQFYAELIDKSGAPAILHEDRDNPDNWPEYCRILEKHFLTKTQAEWCALLEGSDACFAPVLTLEEAKDHPHMCAREAYRLEGNALHTPAVPRFSRTPGEARPSVELVPVSNPWI